MKRDNFTSDEISVIWDALVRRLDQIKKMGSTYCEFDKKVIKGILEYDSLRSNE